MVRILLAAMLAALAALPAAAQTAEPTPTPAPLTEEDLAALEKALAECTTAAEPDARFALCDALVTEARLPPLRLAEAHIARGEAHQLKGAWLPAIADYEAALVLHPGHPLAHLRRGQTLDLMGRPERALEDIDYALLLRPGYTDALRSRAIVYCKLQRYDEALADRIDLIKSGAWPAADAQKWLADNGYFTGVVDGTFGDTSEAALRTWTEQGCPRP